MLALSAFLKAAREMGCNELEEYIVMKCLRNELDLLKNLSIIENMAKEQGEEPKDTEAKKADQAMKAFSEEERETRQRRFEEASEQGKFRWRRRGRRR